MVSIYTWGFNSFGEAFFIMNFFHALQYFGIVWAFEKRNMLKLFHLDRLPFGKPLAAVLFVAVGGAYGFWVEALDTSIEALWAVTLIVSIMHFWYDGFVWSVRKKQVSRRCASHPTEGGRRSVARALFLQPGYAGGSTSFGSGTSCSHVGMSHPRRGLTRQPDSDHGSHRSPGPCSAVPD